MAKFFESNKPDLSQFDPLEQKLFNFKIRGISWDTLYRKKRKKNNLKTKNNFDLFSERGKFNFL